MNFAVGIFMLCTRYRQEYILYQLPAVIWPLYKANPLSDSHTKIKKTYKKSHSLSPNLRELCSSDNSAVIHEVIYRGAGKKNGGKGTRASHIWQLHIEKRTIHCRIRNRQYIDSCPPDFWPFHRHWGKEIKTEQKKNFCSYETFLIESKHMVWCLSKEILTPHITKYTNAAVTTYVLIIWTFKAFHFCNMSPRSVICSAQQQRPTAQCTSAIRYGAKLKNSREGLILKAFITRRIGLV